MGVCARRAGRGSRGLQRSTRWERDLCPLSRCRSGEEGAQGPTQILPQAPEMPTFWNVFILTSPSLEEQKVIPTGNRSHEGGGFGRRVGWLFDVSASVPHTTFKPRSTVILWVFVPFSHPPLPSLYGSLNQALLGQPLHVRFNDKGEITLVKCVHSSPH